MKALVVGGTGPVGPAVVEGLLDRGYSVTIFHTGQHEVTFSRPVAHLHGDPAFKETMEETIGDRCYDVVVAMYGRLRITAEVMRGRTDRLLAVTSGLGYADRTDPRWGPLGRPFAPSETGVWQIEPEGDKLSYLVHLGEEKVLEEHDRGSYSASVIRPLAVYGPRQPAATDWCIVRRALDGRRRFILADSGVKMVGRVFADNVAAAILLTLDKPQESAGRRYNVVDEPLFTIRQHIEFVAAVIGHQFEFVDMPFALAKPCHVLWRHGQGHLMADSTRIRVELGYREAVGAPEAITRTVRWLLDNRPEPGGEVEMQLGDPFNYPAEDELVASWEQAVRAVDAVPYAVPQWAHQYRHPKHPGEPWTRPTSSSLTVPQ